MSSSHPGSAAPALRDQILSDPGIVLDDPDLLQALVAAQDETRGADVVDMRSLAMARMESRIDALERTHQSVISAAYFNVSTTQQVHRALLTMIAPTDFDDFLANLDSRVADCLRIRAVRVVMEADSDSPDCDLNPLSGTLTVLAPAAVSAFLDAGAHDRHRAVMLRQVAAGEPRVYGTAAADIRSEAVVEMDLGPDRAPAPLVLGAAAPDHYAPGQATDLLELFARVCGRMLRGWLG